MLINFEPYMHLVHRMLGHDVVIAGKEVSLVAITPKEPLTTQTTRDDALSFRLHVRDFRKLKLDSIQDLRHQVVEFKGEFNAKKQPRFKICGATVHNDTVYLQLQPLKK